MGEKTTHLEKATYESCTPSIMAFIDALDKDYKTVCKKHDDACATIGDLLEQVESLQIANKNLYGQVESKEKKIADMTEQKKGMCVVFDVKEKILAAEQRKTRELGKALADFQVSNTKLQEKNRKLKKKIKLLVKALSC